MDNRAIPQPDRTSGGRRWWALGAICFGLFMSLLDITVVNVALPVIGSSLRAGLSDLQWVIDAYTLSLAVLIAVAGRLGDLFGRKRLFLVGLALFSLGSLLCALSPDLAPPGVAPVSILIAARAFQGVGGAIMLPLALALISVIFRGKELGVAYGLYGGVSALAVAAGPLVGGALVQSAGWPSIFLLNVPIGLVAILASLWAIPESRDDHAERRIDVAGLLLLTLGLGALFLALIQANDRGWGSPSILGLFAAAAAGLAAFVFVELRQPHPMVDLTILRNPGFTGASLVGFSLSAALYSLLFFIGLYLENYLGLAASSAGLAMLTLSAPILLFSPLAGVLTDRIGSRWVIIASMAILTGSLALMLRMGPSDLPGAWVALIPAFVGCGIANGLIYPPMSKVAVESVEPARAGMASGVTNLFRQLGTGFGIALLGALLSSRYDALVSSTLRAAIRGAGGAAGGAAIVRAGGDHAAPQGGAAVSALVEAVRRAGVLAGSAGLRHPPETLLRLAQAGTDGGATAAAAHSAATSPLVGQAGAHLVGVGSTTGTGLRSLIQAAVRSSFIGGLDLLFVVAALIAAGGLVAAVLLVGRRSAVAEKAATPRMGG